MKEMVKKGIGSGTLLTRLWIALGMDTDCAFFEI